MTDVAGEVLHDDGADGSVVISEKYHVTVELDNLRDVPPPIKKGSCIPDAFSWGELVKMNFEVIGPNDVVVRQGDTEWICLPYAVLNEGKRKHTFEFTFDTLGEYHIDINIEGKRDLVDVADGIDTFRVDVVEKLPSDPGNGNGENGNDDPPSEDKSLLQVAVENPIGTVVVLGAGGVALNQAMDFGD